VSDVLMRTPITVSITPGPDKLVRFPTEHDAVPMGMHGELAEFFGAAPGAFTPRASTLDYVAGAVAACLAGTLKRTLAARGITLTADDLEVRAEGVIAVRDGVPVLQAVEVHYTLTGVAPEDREKAERAHAVHDRACSVSRSLEAAIDIRTSLTLA
jgi:uncharacterized OsmC-like protein